jgi:colanic acid/amylovoran biosynthesis glycosyltransferase
MRPRLLVVLPDEPSPSETFLRAHIEQLPFEVSVVAGRPPALHGQPLLSQALPARAWRKGLRVLRGQGWDAEATAAYTEALRRCRPDVVLAEYGEVGVAVHPACQQAGVPLVVHYHGYDASMTEVLQRLGSSYRALFRDAAAVVAVSRAMREQLLRLGADPQRLHWNAYGVDCEQFAGADPLRAPPTFLAVGRLTAKKAPDLTLHAFACMHRTRPETRLRVIGFGPLLEPCRALAQDLGVAYAVTFPGVQPPGKVQEEMRAARCFVQHSVVAADGDMEGTPVSILEAGASGLPVVATRHAGIPDVIVDGQTGFLVAERDVESMAERMGRLADDAVLAGALGQAGRQRMVAEFSLKDRINRLGQIIAGCVPANGSCGPRVVPCLAETEA